MTMLVLRGLYKSGIIVDQWHKFDDTPTNDYKNELYRDFVSMLLDDLYRDFVSTLLDDHIEENDVLLRVEWIHGDIEKAV